MKVLQRKGILMILFAVMMPMVVAAQGDDVLTFQNTQLKLSSVERQKVSLSKELQQIEKAYGVQIFYMSKAVNGKYVYNLLTTKADPKKELESILTDLLQPLNMKFRKLAENSYVVMEKKVKEIPKPVLETVTGEVTDANSGETLPGVNVIIKGTTTGTSTDVDGRYELTVESLQDTLVFSFVGFQTQEVPINGRTEVDVSLQSQAISGEELVVIGYGSVRRRDLTGSVSSLSAENGEANKGGNVANIDQMLQGRIAGVQVTQASAAPGGGVSVRIRGVNSVNTNSEPLYVVDGQPIDNSTGATPGGQHFANTIPSNPLNALNPQDIASIQVLKDASATAIYGARGANGVIIITTKKGSGDFNIDYGYSIGMQKVANKFDVLSAPEYATVMNELETARGNDVMFTESDINSIGNGTDWQDEVLRPATNQEHSLSLSNQDEFSRYYFSLNYKLHDGIMIKSDLERISGRANYEYNRDKFTFGVNLTATNIGENLGSAGSTQINYMADAINHAINTPPIYSVYDEDGNYTRPYAGTLTSVTMDNPVAVAKEVSMDRKTNRAYGNAFAEYEILPNTVAKVLFAGDVQNVRSDAYRSTLTFRGAAFNGVGQIQTHEKTNTLLEGTLNYVNSFNEHSVNLLAGYTYEDFERRFFTGETQDFPSDLLKTNNLSTGSRANHLLNSNKFIKRISSYFGRTNYNYSDRYLFTSTFRVDGSSNFGINNKYAFFPSFAIAWRPLEESFISNSGDIFSDLKVRASWGKTGNDQIGLGRSLTTYESSGNVLFGQSQFAAISPARIPNPDLKWEATTQINFGIDFGLFENKISGSVEYFKKNTKDMLLNLPVPSATGFSFITNNIGEVQNSGIELSLNTRNISISDFLWTTSLNFSTLKNEVIDTGPLSRIVFGVGGGDAVVTPGLPAFTYYGLEADGIFQEGDDIANSAQPSAEPGHPRWRDVNGDDQINDEDRVDLGNPFPDYTFGVSNTLNYKNLELNVFIEGAQGHQIFNYGLVDALFPNDPARNRLAEPLLNRWTPDNPTNEWPSSVDPSAYDEGVASSLSIDEASFIRLKNVQLTYRVPVEKIDVINLRSASVFINGENLAIITDYRGFDPDVNTRAQDNVRIDRNAYPRARTLTVGVNLGF